MTQLKTLRKQKKLTLKALGKKLGVTPQNIHQLERNGIIKTTTAQFYAAALGCDPRDLLDWK